MKPHQKHLEYQRKMYSMRQVRDCVNGSDAIKRSGELYLPMPSGMAYVKESPSANATSQNALADMSLSINQTPWYHSNPAYSAYLQRARFPDITASTLKGLSGVATRNEPEVDLDGSIAYLEDVATICGDDIYSLYESTLIEVLQVGRHALVVDVRSDNTLYIAQYSSESYINWRYEVINGKKLQTYAEFETTELDEDNEEIKKSLCYALEAEEGGALVCVAYHYTNGKLDEDGRRVIAHQGKTLDFLPIVNVGAKNNTADPDPVPLLGISDCALDVYRHSADINQSHYMCCNPTLLFTGVDVDDSPKVIGSTVAIALSDPQSDGKYIEVSATGLDHISKYVDSIFQEAVHYGAQLLGPTKRAAESAEALSLRQASAGATLVTMVTRVGDAIQDVLDMALRVLGKEPVEDMFTPNKEFAELALSSQDMAALLQSWMSGGISHITYLENLAAAGKLGDRTPEEEQDLIEMEVPVMTGGTVNEQQNNQQQTDDGKN